MKYGLDTIIPHLLNGKPTHCHWCANSLARLRNIYKGKDCERYYCSQDCLTNGEDRALRYRATLAGRVCSPWYVVLAAILAVFVLGFTVHPKARAQEQAEKPHHSPWHDFYKEWQQPIPSKASCCNARFDKDGNEVGDCEATTFELRNSKEGVQWYAYVPVIKQTLPVPWEKIIREKNPDHTGRDGHVCYSLTSGFLCAVPPTGSM